MSIADLIRSMAAAGAPPEAIAIAVEALEAGAARDADRRAKQAERKRKSRQSRERTVTVTGQSQDSHGTDEDTSRDTPLPPCLDKENPPAPPKEINPNPPLPPISVGSDKPNDNVVGLFGDIEGKTGKRKPANQKPAYSPLFGLVWETFPKHPNASKQQAFTEFQRLSEDDQNLALDGAMAFQEILAETRARNPRYDPPHLSTWLHQRRFDDALEAKPQFRMYNR